MTNTRLTSEQVEELAWDLIRQGIAPGHDNLLEQVQKKVDELLNPPERSSGMVRSYTRADGKTGNQEVVHLVLWRLMRAGVIEPGTAERDSISYRNTRLVKGASSDPLPADPRFLDNLKQDGIDDVSLHYVRESVRCLNAGAYSAAVAMVGVASESVVESLIETFSTSIFATADLKKKLAKTWHIKKRYELFEEAFAPHERTMLREARVSDGSTKFLAAAVEAIRLDRNKAGHPSGQMFEAGTVQAYLLLFRSNFGKIRVLREYIEGQNQQTTQA